MRTRLYDVVSALEEEGYELCVTADRENGRVIMSAKATGPDGRGESVVATLSLHNNTLGCWEEDRLWESVGRFIRKSKSEVA